MQVEGAIKLGVRPEDCTVMDAKTKTSHITGKVFSVEPTGDSTYLTLHVSQNKIEIKADWNYRADLGLIEEVELDTERLHLFDAENGQRVR